MTTIPDEIMEQAREVYAHLTDKLEICGCDACEARGNTIIAKALLAAEKRGEERERERCARVAEAKFDLRHQTQARFAAMNIAAAIRSGS